MNQQDKIRLKVLGISYSQIQSGAYALILAQADGPYRIPVVIGASEAQSIAIRMENIIPPRPMTHDLFVSFAHAFGVELKEVLIYKFEDGIFSSELTFTDGERQVVIDSRTSDAIGIAMRTKAPIYTTREILNRTTATVKTTTILPERARHRNCPTTTYVTSSLNLKTTPSRNLNGLWKS